MSEIESWTRRVLETEARKRGIRNPEARSRLELARLIVQHDYTSTRSTRRMIGKMIGEAAAKLPMFVSGRASSEEPRRSSAAYGGGYQAPAGAKPQPGPSAAEVERTAQSAGAAEAHPPAAETSPTAQTQSAHAAAQRAMQAPAAPSGGSAGATPAQTATAPAPSEPASAPRRDAAALQPTAASIDRLDYARHVPRELHLRWQVSDAGAERARVLLGMRGELAVRIVSVRADASHVVRSEVTEHGPIESSGEWTAQLASADTHCVTAVGLRNDAGRFVSIVHRSSRPTSPVA